jgi:hypothetical protein
LGLLYGQDIARFARARVQIRELASARKRWSDRPFSRYRLTLATSRPGDVGPPEEPCHQEIEIQGESVVVVEGSCNVFWKREMMYPSITGLFDALEREIRDPSLVSPAMGYARVVAVYDEMLGYPVHLSYHLDRDWGQPVVAVLVLFPDTRVTLTPLE